MEEVNQPTAVKVNPKPIIQDFSSNTSLSKEETLAIKRKNPTEALRRLQKLHMLSTGTKSSNSSSASLAYASEGTVNLLIQQLKDDIFEVDLLNVPQL